MRTQVVIAAVYSYIVTMLLLLVLGLFFRLKPNLQVTPRWDPTGTHPAGDTPLTPHRGPTLTHPAGDHRPRQVVPRRGGLHRRRRRERLQVPATASVVSTVICWSHWISQSGF